MARNRKALLITFPVLVALVMVVGFPSAASSDSTVVVKGDYYGLSVSKAVASKYQTEELLGVHSLWWGHAEGLFRNGSVETRTEVIEFLSLTRGSVRYGGGANEVSWRACAGPLEGRPKVRAATWAGPMQCRFGIEQYLELVKVSRLGSTWMIANIAGIDHVLMSTPDMASEVAAEANYVLTASLGKARYWELGNELERGRYEWSPERIAERVSAAGRAILDVDPDARLVVPLIEFDHPKQQRRSIFNHRLLTSITLPAASFALHLYYDGRPGGPSVSRQLNTVSETAAQLKKSDHAAASIWITEHGRWPEGDSADPQWKRKWSQTNDMNGVMSTADFLIGLTQIGAVEGAHLHGLRAGPWNVFDVANGNLRLTGVGELLSFFGSSGARQRLISVTTSRNESGYAGGYDVRAAAFTKEVGRMVAWVVNRAPNPVAFSLGGEQRILKDGKHYGRSLVCIKSPAECGSGDFRTVQLVLDRADSVPTGVQITLPAYSVSILDLELLQ